ncbi:MAG: acyl carrier protein [Kiritimatiellae bacterium]|nr:acyl carrier protein [Kiritimatiellia bacterium]
MSGAPFTGGTRSCASAADDFIAFAASVLGVPPETLTSETACGDIPEWDSVMHLRLVMEAEARYDVSIPLEAIPNLHTLADFARAVRALA